MIGSWSSIKNAILDKYEDLISPDRPVYIFHHIPKSGGTSVRLAILQWFKIINDYRPSIKLTPETKWFLENKLNIEQYNSRYCIAGHFESPGNFLHERYPQVLDKPEEFRIFSIFRDPLELAISLYYHELKYKDNTNHEKSLINYLKNVSNYIAHRLPCNENNYKDILDKYFFIGLNEYMQESFDILARLLNKAKIIVPHVNSSKRDDQLFELSIEFKEEFKKNNYLDYLIYSYVLGNLKFLLNEQ